MSKKQSVNKQIIVLIAVASTVFFSSGNSSYAQNSLEPGQQLSSGNSIYSNNGCFALKLQPDGNLVLFDSNQPLWASGTDGRSVESLRMQPDGNLVMYGYNGQPIWASNTADNDGSRLVVQNDGNLVLYTPSRTRPVWSTNTVSRRRCTSSMDTNNNSSYVTPNNNSIESLPAQFNYVPQSNPSYSPPTPDVEVRQPDNSNQTVDIFTGIIKGLIQGFSGN